MNLRGASLGGPAWERRSVPVALLQSNLMEVGVRRRNLAVSHSAPQRSCPGGFPFTVELARSLSVTIMHDKLHPYSRVGAAGASSGGSLGMGSRQDALFAVSRLAHLLAR